MLVHRTGVLMLDGTVEAALFTIDGAEGGLVLDVPGRAFEADQWVLHVPEEGPGCVQALLEANALDERVHGRAVDKHMATHGKARHPCWAYCRVVAARLGNAVVEGEEIDLRNPLHGAEFRLCRALNADRAMLAAMCLRACGRAIESPMAVGIDRYGIEVRTTFGVVRLAFTSEATTETEAEALIASMRAAAGR